jgi:hypothetical protein
MFSMEITMKPILAYMLIASFAVAGFSLRSLADDSNSTRPVVTHKKMMKDCMAKERAANAGATREDMKKTCEAKIKSFEDHPSETTAPPNNPG